MMKKLEFGNRIRELRKNKGLTLEALAEKIGSTKSYVWELENKPNIRPSATKVYKIAVVLETTVEDLMGETVSADEIEDQVFFRELRKNTVSADEIEDQVFFREYHELKLETKQQLKSILNVLKQSK